MKDDALRITTTDEYRRLAVNFMKNELEIDPFEPVPTDLVKCWKLVDDKKPGQDGYSDYIAGGCVLCMREGEYIIDGIAVDGEYRKSDWGRKLLETAIQEAKSLNAKAIYLVARAPGFFKKHGFGTVERESAPEFFECFTCPQYNETCHPEVMKLSL